MKYYMINTSEDKVYCFTNVSRFGKFIGSSEGNVRYALSVLPGQVNPRSVRGYSPITEEEYNSHPNQWMGEWQVRKVTDYEES